jgi:hypothetical protein
VVKIQNKYIKYLLLLTMNVNSSAGYSTISDIILNSLSFAGWRKLLSLRFLPINSPLADNCRHLSGKMLNETKLEGKNKPLLV